MYIVVTGAAGFIGSSLIRALNARGETQIVAVDSLSRADTFRNLVDCDIADYFDKDEFLPRLADGDFDDDLAAVLHQGACTDTMMSASTLRICERALLRDWPSVVASRA